MEILLDLTVRAIERGPVEIVDFPNKNGDVPSFCESLPEGISTLSGWWFQPVLKNMKASWDYYSQYVESHKNHVPNHQPVMVI